MSRLLVLAAVAATLAGVIVSELMPMTVTASAAPPERQTAPDLIHGEAGSIPELPVGPWVATALERPLFRENRRPAKPAAGVVQVDRAVQMTGVITGPFGNRAIFASPDNPKPIVAAEGGKISDFVVRSISPGLVIVETETGIRTLRLSFGRRP